MALKIAKPTNYGSPALYWRVIGQTIDYRAKTARIVLEGFLDEAAARDGFQPVVPSAMHLIKGAAFVARFGEVDGRAAAYEFLKSNAADWAEAETV